LITSERAYIRPKEELVRLTLTDVKQESEEEETKRRQSLNTDATTSILDSEIPDLIEIDEFPPPPRAPVSSPQFNPGDFLSPTHGATSGMSKIQLSGGPDDSDYEFVEHESNDSGVMMSLPMSDHSPADKENSGNESPVRGRPRKSPLGESQQVNVMTTEVVDEDVEMTDIVREPLSPPKTPPPIPQRPRRKSTWGALKYGAQQDVTECITNCLSQLHAGFKPEGFDANGQPIDLFKQYSSPLLAPPNSRLFYIRVKHVFRAMPVTPSANPIEEKEELFGSMVPVYVDATATSSLYDAIDLALGREQIEYKGIGEAEKSTTITSLPPILQIQIVRTQFNRSVGAGYKENAHLELESKIFMDRYMEIEGDDELAARRDDYWKWKVELESAQKKKTELLRKVPKPPFWLFFWGGGD
jgi:Ubiquitin carboxyl-terminal hydrolase